jgi:hypothetical protein
MTQQNPGMNSSTHSVLLQLGVPTVAGVVVAHRGVIYIKCIFKVVLIIYRYYKSSDVSDKFQPNKEPTIGAAFLTHPTLEDPIF